MSFCPDLLDVCDYLRALRASFYGGTRASSLHEGTGATEGVDVEGVEIC